MRHAVHSDSCSFTGAVQENTSLPEHPAILIQYYGLNVIRRNETVNNVKERHKLNNSCTGGLENSRVRPFLILSLSEKFKSG